MKTTIEFMLAVQKKENLKTPYAIAKFLGISPTSLYRYMDGSQTMDDYTSLKVAKALGLDPMGVIAAANAERAKTEEEKKDWTEIVKKVGGRAAAILLTTAALMVLTVSNPIPTQAASKNSVYYVKYWIRSSARPDLCNLTKPGTLPRQTMAR